jgi:sialidase-1
MDCGTIRIVILVSGVFSVGGLARAETPANVVDLDPATRARCLSVLRAGLTSGEFWPSMHAAEGLTLAGQGAEVRAMLVPMLPKEKDDQQRCGLARELVRTGDLAFAQVLLDILASPNPHGHVHAAESLFKVWQVGDGTLLRRAMAPGGHSKLTQMAAAALARWGNQEALALLRESVRVDDGESARIAAWILARTGDRSDLPALRSGARRFTEPLTKAYFEHALATLGDDEGMKALIRNLGHADPSVRVYAAEFAPDARAIGAKDALVRLLDDPVLDVRLRSAQALVQLAQPAPPAPGEDIRRDVFVATAQHPRVSEGSVAVLRDGRLLYATTEFEGSGSDFATARIVAVESADAGRSWGERRVLQENVGQTNVMSATLRRLGGPARFDGPIGFFYVVKNSTSDLQVDLRVSEDEGKTFGEPSRVTDRPGYHVLNNDRVTVLSTGRLVVPVASTEDVSRVNTFACACFLSDDRGRTWRRSRGEVTYPRRGAMEPEVLELSNGRLLMHFRTQLGHIAVSELADGGETWSEARSWDVRAPEAPATLRRIPSTDHLLLIWNDVFSPGAGHGGKRTPLTAAVSTDEGRTWSFRRDLETGDRNTFAYTSVAFHRGRALLTYYVRDEASGRISSRFRSVPIAWFYESGGSR